MADFASLTSELNDDAVPEVDVDSIPEPKAGRREALYPGTYELTLPAAFDGKIDDLGERKVVVAQFYDAYAITADPGGLKWTGRLTNRPYPQTVFAPNGDRSTIEVNDLALLLKALGYKGVLTTNKDYVAALVKYPGAKFLANIAWSATCNAKNPIYKDGQKQEGTLGCGKRYTSDKPYTKKDGTQVVSIPKDEAGRFASEFICACGAELLVNDNLTKIRSKR